MVKRRTKGNLLLWDPTRHWPSLVAGVLSINNIRNMPELILVVGGGYQYRIADLPVLLTEMAITHMTL